MEKVKFKVVLGTLSFAFFLLLGMNRVEAQVSSTTVGSGVPSAKPGSPAAVLNVPQGNFVNTDDALLILGNELATLKEQLAVLTPGNYVYTSVLNQYNYFSNIDNELRAGTTVPLAIVEGLEPFTIDAMGVLSQSSLSLLRQSAISKLQI